MTYHVNRRILEFVLLLVIEEKAVLFDVADDRSLPSWTLQERDQAVENPVLYNSVCNTDKKESILIVLTRLETLSYFAVL